MSLVQWRVKSQQLAAQEGGGDILVLPPQCRRPSSASGVKGLGWGWGSLSISLVLLLVEEEQNMAPR